MIEESVTSIPGQSFIDVGNKTIHLIGEVNEHMYATVQEGIGRLADSEGDYCFTLNSYGGNLTDGLAIYELITHFCGNTKIIVLGSCMSAAFVILQAGTERVASPMAEFMLHYGSEEADNGEAKKHNKRLFNKMRDCMLSKSKVSKTLMTKWCNSTKYMDSQEALEKGFVDRIMGDDNGQG